MARPIDPRDLERRAYRDTVQDGLLEIAAGVYLALIAGLFYPPAPAGYSRLIAIFGLAALLALARDRLRRRLSYPRIGYVELIPQDPKKLLAGMAVVTLGALAVVLAGLAVSGHIDEPAYLYRWVPAWVGAATAGGFFDVACRSGYARYYLYTAVSVASGLAFSLVAFPARLQGLALDLWLVGGVLVAGGTITLIRFLRRNPRQPGGAGDEND